MRILSNIQKGIESFLSHLKRRNDYIELPNLLSYLEEGDRVEDKEGNRGSVVRKYRTTETNQLAGCIVIWDYPQNGSKISTLLPVEDKGREFNPLIRRIEK